MAFYAKKGTITCPASTGNHSTTDWAFADPPKAVLFWGTKQTAEGIGNDATQYIGAATSSSQRWCASAFYLDNVTTTDVGLYTSKTKCIHAMATAATSAVVADFVSMNSNGITVNFSTVTSGVIIHYLAFGGSDITNVKAGAITVAASVGTQDFTDPAFTPDLTLFCNSSLSGSTVDTFLANGGLQLGAGLSASARWVTSGCGRDAQTMEANQDNMNTQRTDNVYLALIATGPALDGLGDYNGGIANGFQFDVTDAPTASDEIFYLAFQGGSYAVGAFNASTSVNGTNDVSISFTPEAVLLATWSLATSTSITDDVQMNVGAATYDGTEGWAGHTDDDAIEPTNADSVTSTTKAIGSLIEGAPATLDSEADSDLTGVGGANTFRLTWTDPPAVAAEVCYIAFGPHTAGITTEYVAPIHEQRTGGVMIGRRYV